MIFINIKRNAGIIRKSMVSMVLLLVLFSTGCTTENYKADFLKTFNKYLTYSLGDFKFDKQRIVKSSLDVIPNSYKCTEWTLKYKDAKGKTKHLCSITLPVGARIIKWAFKYIYKQIMFVLMK
jgi:hypothetical protein